MNVIKYSRKAHCCHSVKLTFGLRKYKACSINKVGVIEAVALASKLNHCICNSLVRYVIFAISVAKIDFIGFLA